METPERGVSWMLGALQIDLLALQLEGELGGELPRELSLMPGGQVNTDALRDAVWSVARDMAAGGHGFPHIAAFLRRDALWLSGLSIGLPIIERIDRDEPSLLLEVSKRAVASLERSWLMIQGPPGSGKTYSTSHLIASLVRAGKTVGFASNSHKALDNVLHCQSAFKFWRPNDHGIRPPRVNDQIE